MDTKTLALIKQLQQYANPNPNFATSNRSANPSVVGGSYSRGLPIDSYNGMSSDSDVALAERIGQLRGALAPGNAQGELGQKYRQYYMPILDELLKIQQQRQAQTSQPTITRTEGRGGGGAGGDQMPIDYIQRRGGYGQSQGQGQMETRFLDPYAKVREAAIKSALQNLSNSDPHLLKNL